MAVQLHVHLKRMQYSGKHEEVLKVKLNFALKIGSAWLATPESTPVYVGCILAKYLTVYLGVTTLFLVF